MTRENRNSREKAQKTQKKEDAWAQIEDKTNREWTRINAKKKK
jgi:hypothetical protein